MHASAVLFSVISEEVEITKKIDSFKYKKDLWLKRIL
jgi:hypothetical protein